MKELKFFLDDLAKLTQNLEFRSRSNEFLTSLKEDLKRIDEQDDIIVNADKTSNKYTMKPKEHNELLEKNKKSEYKKETKQNFDAVNTAHQNVVSNLELEERVFKTTQRAAFISIKDHRENFMNDPQVRLLNPCKPEIGKISNQILKKVIKIIRDKSELIQWKNTDEVIDWFKNLTNK